QLQDEWLFDLKRLFVREDDGQDLGQRRRTEASGAEGGIAAQHKQRVPLIEPAHQSLVLGFTEIIALHVAENKDVKALQPFRRQEVTVGPRAGKLRIGPANHGQQVYVGIVLQPTLQELVLFTQKALDVKHANGLRVDAQR